MIDPEHGSHFSRRRTAALTTPPQRPVILNSRNLAGINLNFVA